MPEMHLRLRQPGFEYKAIEPFIENREISH